MILVTGATGLVGSFICKRLVDEGKSVRILIRDISKSGLIYEYLQKVEVIQGDILDVYGLEKALQGVSVVIHAAAVVSFHKSDKEEMMKVNVEGTANLVNAGLKQGIEHLIFISSVAALGRSKNSLLINESTKWQNSSYNSRYGISKYLSELEIWRGQEEGLDIAIVNPSTVLGPGDWNRSSSSLFRLAWHENRFYTNGKVNYVDIRDVVEIVVRIVEQKVTGHRFIVSAGHTTYKKLFTNMATSFNKKAPFIVVNKTVARLYAFTTWIFSLFTRKKPKVSSEAARLSNMQIYYENEKVKDYFTFQFRTLNETISWACAQYLDKNRT